MYQKVIYRTLGKSENKTGSKIFLEEVSIDM